MNFQKEANELQQNIISSIGKINNIPEGLLPHIVFVEEEQDGSPIYVKYQLTDLLSDGKCILVNPETNQSEERDLIEINLDWLITFWNWHLDLSGQKEEEAAEEKELFTFLYPVKRFDRNATNEEIVSDYENDEGADPCTEKYTPDEFAAMINDEEFADNEYWVRFIKI